MKRILLLLFIIGSQDPFIKLLPGPQFLLGGMGGMGVLIDGNGDPTSGVVEWNGNVLGSAYTFPYVVSLILTDPVNRNDDDNDGVGKVLKNGIVGGISGAVGGIGGIFKGNSNSTSREIEKMRKSGRSKIIEIHSVIDRHRIVQTIQAPPDSITILDNSEHHHDFKNRSGDSSVVFNRFGVTAYKVTSNVLFASSTAIYQVEMLPYKKQVKQLLGQCNTDAAHGLLSALTLPNEMNEVMTKFSIVREGGGEIFLIIFVFSSITIILLHVLLILLTYYY